MNATTVLRAFKPNTTLFGYASFLAVNAAGAWGGVFPLLPMKLQEPQTLFWFFLVQSLVFAACFFLSVVGSYHLPGPTRLFIVRLSAVPYLLGWFCLIGAMYLDAWMLPLVIAGGGFIGVGSAGFYMLWQRLFASQDSDAGNHDLILGTAYASVLYFALHLIPRAVTVYLIPLVITPFFALAISLKSREINFDQPMFEDVPKKNRGVYRQAISTLARPALCVGSLGLCAGLIRALAIDDPAIGSLVNALSMGASLVTAVAFMVLWQFKSVRLNVVSLFRIVFPVIITGFVLLPFLG
ncbi:MAG: LuxR family transcriptional regulator, partial [Eggerthella sp.]|nr:LuxR family transcriptional regulator [Eggerthella sp.]